MIRSTCATLIVLLYVVLSGGIARADYEEFAADTKPNISAPRMNSFELNADELSRGGFSLPSVFVAAPTRSLALIDIFPRYHPDAGITEWGQGWDNPQLRVQRKQIIGPPRFNETDLLVTRWGMLQMSAGRYLSQGLTMGVEASFVDGNLVATETDGTRFSFTEKVKANAGTAVWYLTKVEHPDGDSVELVYRHETGYPLLSTVSWRKSGQVTLQCLLSYDVAPVPLLDYSLGQARGRVMRMRQVSLSTTNRKTGGGEAIRTYFVSFRDAEPWQVESVREVSWLDSRTSEHVHTYSYGDFWAVQPGLSVPQPQVVTQAASLPTYDDRVDMVTNPDHAMRATNVTGSYFFATDFENDGITDFLHQVSATQPSWWRSSNGTYARSRETGPRATDRCTKLEIPPLISTSHAGDAEPVLFEVTAASERGLATIVQCDHEANEIGVETLAFRRQSITECAGVSPLVADGTIYRQSLSDVNQDGVVDILFADDCSIYIALGRRVSEGGVVFGDLESDGTYSPTRIPVPGLMTSDRAALFDVNGDGLIDVITTRRSFRVWFATHMAGDLPVFTSAPSPLPVTGEPSPPCDRMFQQLDSVPFIDLIEACADDSTFFFRGTIKGFSLTRREQLPGNKTLHSLAGFAPGLQLIERKPRIRQTSAESCPAGTRPSTVTEINGSTTLTREYCSPLVEHVPLRAPNAGRLTAVYDGEGRKVEFEYQYDKPRSGFGATHVVLHSIVETVGGRDTRRRTLSYDAPAAHPEAGFFWGYRQVVVQDDNATLGLNGPRVEFGYTGRSGTWVLETTQTLALDGTLTVEEQRFAEKIFRGVPLVQKRLQFTRVGSATTGLALIKLETWSYAPNSLCVDKHTTTQGDPHRGGGTVTTAFEYDEFQYDRSLLLADAFLACHASTRRISSDSDDSVAVERTVHDAKGHTIGHSRSAGGKVLISFRRTVGPDGLVTSVEVPGAAAQTFTYEEVAGGRLRLLKSATRLGRTTTYVRHPVADLVVETITFLGMFPPDALPEWQYRGEHVWKGTYDADGRILSEWSTERGSPDVPGRTWSYQKGDLALAASVRIKTAVEIAATNSTARDDIVFLDGLGSLVALGTRWSDTEFSYRISAIRVASEREVRSEGGFLDVQPNATVSYAALEPARLGVITSTRSSGAVEVLTVRVAPATLESWTTTATSRSDGVILITSISSAGRYRSVVQDLNRRSVTTDIDGVISTEQYDSFGRLREVQLPDGDKESQFFDGFGRVEHIERGQLKRFFSYVDGTSLPKCARTTSANNAAESICTEWRPDGLPKQVNYETPAPCRNSRFSSPVEQKVVFEYDKNRNLAGIRGPGFHKKWNFDWEMRPKLEQLTLLKPGAQDDIPDNRWLTLSKDFNYDESGGLQGSGIEVIRDGKVFLYDYRRVDYDDAGWPKKMSAEQRGSNKRGLLEVSISREPSQTVYALATGEKIVFGHADALRASDSVEAKSSDGKSLYRLTRSLDPAGRIKQEEINIGSASQSISYAYDGNRLRRADTGETFVEYEHDASGLLASRKDSAGAIKIARTVNNLTVGTSTWSLDGFGRVRSHDKLDLCWSASNQIQTLNDASNKTRAQFFYDETGTRLFTATWDADDKLRLNAEVDGLFVAEGDKVTASSSVVLNGHLSGSLDLVGWHPAAFDSRNSSLYREGANVSSLGPYGEKKGIRQPERPDFVSSSYEPSLRMLRLGHRDYIPEAGQFAQSDDIFLNSLELCARSAIGCNLFGYTSSDPVNHVDPTGYLEIQTPPCAATYADNGECAGGSVTYSDKSSVIVVDGRNWPDTIGRPGDSGREGGRGQEDPNVAGAREIVKRWNTAKSAGQEFLVSAVVGEALGVALSYAGAVLVETTVAASGAVALPTVLRGGEAASQVYLGVRNGERVYVGITNDLARRQAEHGGRFVLERITQSPVTRGEARAIEQALIDRNPGFENIRNSISPNHSWYGQAVEWGEAWLKAAGF